MSVPSWRSRTMAVWSLAPSAVSAIATGRATRTSPALVEKSAKPNGLLSERLDRLGRRCADRHRQRLARREMPCASEPCACLSNRIEADVQVG